jgi:hypothetical protein
MGVSEIVPAKFAAINFIHPGCLIVDVEKRNVVDAMRQTIRFYWGGLFIYGGHR